MLRVALDENFNHDIVRLARRPTSLFPSASSAVFSGGFPVRSS